MLQGFVFKIKSLLKNKIRKIKNSETLKNIFTLSTGSTLSQAISLLMLPILTRLYTPGDFGVLAIYMAFVFMFGIISTGRYDLAIMLPKKDEDSINILALSLIIVFFVSIFIFLIFCFLNNSITKILNNERISALLYLIPFSVLFMGIYQSHYYWLNRKKQYKIMALSRFLHSSSAESSRIAFGFMWRSPIGLVLGMIVGQFVSTGFIGSRVYKNYRKKYELIAKGDIIKQAKRYKNFPIYSSWSGLLNAASIHIPILILSNLFGSFETGIYSLAHRTLNVPMTLIGASIGQIFFQKASECKHNLNELKLITLNFFKKLLYLGIIPLSLVMIYGDVIFSFVFGSKWIMSGTYARVLSVWLLFVFIGSPLSNLFFVLEKQKQGLVFDALIFFFRIGGLLVGGIIFKDPFIAIVIYGVVGAFFWIGLCVYLLYMVKVNFFQLFNETFVVLFGVPALFFFIRKIVGI